MAGLRALWGWMKSHPWSAALVFLVLVPVVFGGLFVWIRRKGQGLPVVGPVLARIGLTDNLAA